jgi:hypothetical protein
VVGQLGELRANFLLGVGRPPSLAVRCQAIGAEPLLRLLQLARRFPHQHNTTCPLGEVERAVGASTNNPLNADKN